MADQHGLSVPKRGGFSRRDFIQLAGGAVVGGAGVGGALLLRGGGAGAPAAEPPPASKDFLLPGQFPGKVVEVHHPGSMVDGNVNRKAVTDMLARGLKELTDADDATAGWKRLFAAGDVVGIKVNPVGRANPKYPDKLPVITNPETILEVIAGLRSAGVKAEDIIVFERYRDELQACGYDKILPAGVRWDSSSISYDDGQLAIDGYGPKFEKFKTDGSPPVSGYDPEAFVKLDFIFPGKHRPDDPAARRSHLCNIVSKKVNKVVNLCLLKDHSSAGITGALKNMSHGFFNNVARTHGNGHPSQIFCHMFIPAVLQLAQVRQKVTLNIMEGLRGMYQGGPGLKNASSATWEYKSMLFSTDPVTMDRIAWDIIDAKRAREGLPPVGETGVLGRPVKAPVMKKDPDTGERREVVENIEDADWRQIQHIEMASLLGLGVFGPSDKITHRKIALS